MNDVIEVSYTGDILAHRRCPRSWAYEKQAGFHPYEQIQAMEGRLIHHAMEWLTRAYTGSGRHADVADLRAQIEKYFRVLWARGIRTAFTSKQDTIDRVVGNLFPGGVLHPTVRAAVEGAQHTEYELKTVKKVIQAAEFAGKKRILLTGILDLVVQQTSPLSYPRTWVWTNLARLEGEPRPIRTVAHTGDLEIWDYKGTKAASPYLPDYVRQLLTYAALYRERSGELPRRCVLFFVNEKMRANQLLAIPVDETVVDQCLAWTIQQVRQIRATVIEFQRSPMSIAGGGLEDRDKPVGGRVSQELKQQCTACGFRFDCLEYCTHLGGNQHSDVRLTNIEKN